MSFGGSPEETSGARAELAEIAFSGDPFAVATDDGVATGGLEPVNTWAIRPRTTIPTAISTTTRANLTLGPGISWRWPEARVSASVAAELWSGSTGALFRVVVRAGFGKAISSGALSRAKHTGAAHGAPEVRLPFSVEVNSNV
jgi:hypothetical protein